MAKTTKDKEKELARQQQEEEKDELLKCIEECGPDHEAWSAYLEDICGRDAAIAFALGSDWALDHAEEDLECMAHMPRGTHIGELDISYLDGSLPAQFRTRYDYDFLYLLVDRIRGLRKMAKSNKGIVCHTVLEEIALHVICEYAGVIFELADYQPDTVADPVETFAAIAGDLDIDMWLFCRDSLVVPGDNYYFDCWNEPQFFLEPPIEK